jgi:hypothetical protein
LSNNDEKRRLENPSNVELRKQQETDILIDEKRLQSIVIAVANQFILFVNDFEQSLRQSALQQVAHLRNKSTRRTVKEQRESIVTCSQVICDDKVPLFET